jgi:hypothetical protein
MESATTARQLVATYAVLRNILALSRLAIGDIWSTMLWLVYVRACGKGLDDQQT